MPLRTSASGENILLCARGFRKCLEERNFIAVSKGIKPLHKRLETMRNKVDWHSKEGSTTKSLGEGENNKTPAGRGLKRS